MDGADLDAPRKMLMMSPLNLTSEVEQSKKESAGWWGPALSLLYDLL
jgi:hypothetical protein